MATPDPNLDRLLDLAGEVLVISEDGEYWVKFEAWKVAPTPAKPHGVAYSLTLHGPGNERLVGFDNAHPVSPAKWGEAQDHRHAGRRAQPYEYSDAAALLEAFWTQVDAVLDERGVDR